MTLQQKTDRAIALIREITEKPRSSVGFSFSGGKDSAVLIHLARSAMECEYVRAFAVLSNTEFPETRDYINEFCPEAKIFHYTNSGDPEDCCRTPKLERFKEAIALMRLGYWFSGIRADEGVTRAEFEEVEERDGLVKVNPLLHFTETDIWRYLAIHGVPVNPKYKEGYRSLSCARCSVPEQSGDEPERAGRWKGTEHEGCECGIHTRSLR